MIRKVAVVAIGVGAVLSTQADVGTRLDDKPGTGRADSRPNQQARIADPVRLRGPAESGDAGAQYQLGVMYRDGMGVNRSATNAFWWLEQAAKAGHREASYALGLLHADWDNEDEALHWLGIAAKRGHAGADHAYRYMLQHDFGVGC
jgi:TPR repeat protein